MKLSGTWVGEYTYGPDYDQIEGKSVPFLMSLTESWLGTIIGYVRDDDSRGGQPERGRIRGSKKGAKIEFVKTMPLGYVTEEDGSQVPWREFLERAADAPLSFELPPHRIAYTGSLDASGEAMAGAWRIIPIGETEDGEPVGGGSGTWTARRTSYQPSEV